MRLRQGGFIGLLLVATFFINLMPPLLSKVNAAGAFDNTYHTTNTVSLFNTANGSTGACSPVNYSANWPALFDQASNTNSTQRSIINDLKASFETAKQGGRWGVSEFGDASYSGIQIYWTEDTALSLDWMSNGIIRASGAGIKTISFVTQALWMGNSNCTPWARFALDSFSPDVSSENGYTKNYFTLTDYPNYPSNYEGNSIVGLQPITGNVQCANNANVISSIGVDVSSGVGGNATITDDGMGGKNYQFYLPGKDLPYSLIVICDGDAFYGPTVNIDFYRHYYWICTHSTPGQSPNLNICATS